MPPDRPAPLAPAAWLLVRHGLAAIPVALLAGFGLVFALIGGISLSPLPLFFAVDIPGSAQGWRTLHIGMLTNGMLAILLGLVLERVTVQPASVRRVSVGVIVAVWGNFAFYLFGMFAPNRGLTLGANAQGAASLAGALAFLPAIVGAVALIAVILALLRAPAR